jgi:hypothetical protein
VLPIESVELSRTVQLWVLNMFLTFRAGMAEWFCQREELQRRLPDGCAAGSGKIDTRSVNAETRWQTHRRAGLSGGCRSTTLVSAHHDESIRIDRAARRSVYRSSMRIV